MYEIDRDRLIKTFVSLAEISSPSWHEKNIINFLIKRFNKLGAECKTYKCCDSSNLLIKFNGTEKRIPILLSGHLDTVVPCDNVKPVVTETRISSDGTTILGSDDKSAIAIFLEAFEYIKENNMPHGPVEILLSCAEEQGLKGVKGFNLKLLKSRLGFVFDSSGTIGRIVIKAPYHANMKIQIKGRASHAGMAPEKGINAIKVLSEIISVIPSGRIDNETTLNVGIISGGRATNIVAEDAECQLEVRSIEKSKMLALESKVKSTVKTICRKYKAKSSINRTLEYSGFKISPDEDVSLITVEAMKKIKIKPKFVTMGGGSDTNIINSTSIKAINLACGMQRIHSTEEFILIKDLINGAKLVISLINTVK